MQMNREIFNQTEPKHEKVNQILHHAELHASSRICNQNYDRRSRKRTRESQLEYRAKQSNTEKCRKCHYRVVQNSKPERMANSHTTLQSTTLDDIKQSENPQQDRCFKWSCSQKFGHIVGLRCTIFKP